MHRPRAFHLASVVPGALLLLASTLEAQGPLGEYGDAPESRAVQQVEAYPGVVARFPSFYSHSSAVVSPDHGAGTWVNPGATFWLGPAAPDLETDSGQNPSARDNDAAPIVLLEGLGSNPLASLLLTVASAAGHDPDQAVYLNVFLDQNRDGQWKDGLSVATTVAAWNLEWVVQDLAVKLQAGVETELHVVGLRVEAPRDSHWLRMVLTDQPVGEMFRPHPQNGSTGYWDATMPLAHGARGEVEDFLLEFFADPLQMTRGGIALRAAYENRNPGRPPGGPRKPGCPLILRKVIYDRELGFNAPFELRTPWCTPNDGGTDFGLEFKKNDILNGCALAPNALVGLYGPRYVTGERTPPVLNAAGNSPMVAADQMCPVFPGFPAGPKLMLPPNHPPLQEPLWNPGFGSIPLALITPPPPPVNNLWHICYPKGKGLYRLYESPVEARTCGCETQNLQVHSSCYAPCDLSLLSDPGRPVAIEYFNGDLIENFVDPTPPDPRPFPDPNFPNPQRVLLEPEPIGIWRIGSSLAKLGIPDRTPPSSLELNAARYVVRPAIPAGMRATRVSFWVLCEAFDAAVSYQGGGGATIGPKTCSPSAWRQEAFDVPAGSKLDSLTVTMFNGFLDELVVDLESEPTDCDGNGVPDFAQIQTGAGTDCDGDGGLDACQLADDDCNGNLTLDRCEIAAGTATDVNEDGVPDACLVSITDCNGNGVHDADDIAGGTSQDINDNGVPDECEATHFTYTLSGTALGGQVSVTLAGSSATCTVSVVTTPGQSAPTVAANLAAAINADACMSGQGITATASGDTLRVVGFLLRIVESTVTDQGLRLRLAVVDIPTLASSGVLLMVLLLLLAGIACSRSSAVGKGLRSKERGAKHAG